jgi:endonuclease/exonuclease/phosphatase family metal-dependent hydrolase
MNGTAPLRRRAVLLAAGLAAGLVGCGPARDAGETAFRTEPGEVTLLSYFLDDYALLDRTGSGQNNDPKPLAERRAIVDLVRRVAPDLLAVQDLGGPAVFEAFRAELAGAGCVFPHAQLVPAAETGRHLALLSRHPIRSWMPRTGETYRIGSEIRPVQRGFLDAEVELPGGARIRILAAHLKSKDFDPAGQTEMRRNEARLFAAILRRILREDPTARILVAAALNDSPDSAPVREIAAGLTDLRPADAAGDAWTWHDRSQDAWLRTEYLMVSPALLDDTVRGKTRAVRDPAAAAGSSHRPLVAVFRVPPAPRKEP